MAKSEKTSRAVASHASEVLRNPSSSARDKTLAASALSQAGTSRQTSAEVASTASRALDSSRSTQQTRELAASVLTQTPDKKK